MILTIAVGDVPDLNTIGVAATVLNLPPGSAGTTTIESKPTSWRPAGPASCGRRPRPCTAVGTMVWQTRVTDKAGCLLSVTAPTQMVLDGR